MSWVCRMWQELKYLQYKVNVILRRCGSVCIRCLTNSSGMFRDASHGGGSGRIWIKRHAGGCSRHFQMHIRHFQMHITVRTFLNKNLSITSTSGPCVNGFYTCQCLTPFPGRSCHATSRALLLVLVSPFIVCLSFLPPLPPSLPYVPVLTTGVAFESSYR
jgi:hypothetical protein